MENLNVPIKEEPSSSSDDQSILTGNAVKSLYPDNMENLNIPVKGESSSSSDGHSILTGNVITEEMIAEEEKLEKKAIREELEIQKRIQKEEAAENEEQSYKKLNMLLNRSSIYAEIMAEKIKRDKLKEEKRRRIKGKVQSDEQRKRKGEVTNSPRKKRFIVYDDTNDEDIENECRNTSVEDEITVSDGHPSLFTGGTMHPYQIEGFEWIKTLFEHGVNGILADEMGLGKTIQSIAFIAHLIEMGITGPFFVCGPLSTVPNWHAEFRRFAPKIPIMLYHGDRDERKAMRKNILKKVRNGNVYCFPVVITSYSIALNDAKLLSRYEWKLLVIDEAHRIKNFQCKLVCALKTFEASHRLLLTGTPLQNDLCELWSLLNFILPDIFDDLKVFESWFDITRLAQKGGTDEIIAKEQQKQIVSIIHQILTPFLLRRTKSEVQLKLPPKKEVIVHAPLTKLQQDYYTAVLNKTIESTIGSQRGKYFDVEVDINSGRPKRNINCDFNDIYKLLEDEKFEQIPDSAKKVNSEKSDVLAEINCNTRNISMILRRICAHPYLISYPLDSTTGGRKIDEDLIKTSGKLLVLDVMLPELKKRGHKVLLFSQFVTMLEILEDYCMYRGYDYSILCGDMSLQVRQKEIDVFSESKDTFIFLISTKAGGLGINLAKADTVIIYDSDWNPQSDLQAQDRCHRIGQNKPVIVYRLVIPNTVDEKIIERADAKRKLEKVIIKKGRFNSQGSQNQSKSLSLEELLELLKASDNGFVKTDDNCVLTPDQLNTLLDRSDMTECV